MSSDSYGENNTKVESSDRFPCPACGGNMVFHPENQSLTCPYCSNKIDIENQSENIKEYDIETAEDNASQDWGSENRVIQCESCGAETVLDTNSTAQFCAFCGSSHIIKNDDSAGIKPESLIPFKISKDAATDCFSKWIKGRFFAPNALKAQHQMKRMSGVYIPFWTYDSETYSTYRAERGTYYYETKTKWVEENGERKQVTEKVRKIRWQWTSGTYSKFFDDVLVNASKQVDENIIKRLEPFNLNELTHYKPEYLSGFLAEKYSVGLKEGWNSAQNIIDSSIRSGVRRKIGGDEIRHLRVNTSYDDVTFKHILLPIWISAYTYKDKVYKYMVNGQTGEIQGESPVSPLKVIITILICLALIVGGIYLYKHYKG